MPAARSESHPATEPVPFGQKRRVLLVEDHAPLRRGLDRVLSRFFEVKATASMEEAMLCLRQGGFHMVISDYLLPGPRTGADLLRAIHGSHPKVRRVLMAGARPPQLESLVREGVVERFVPKPARIEQLLAMLAEPQDN